LGDRCCLTGKRQASTHRDKRQEIVPTDALCVDLRVIAEVREALNKVIVNLGSGR